MYNKILLEYLPQQLIKLEILELFRKTVKQLGTSSMKHVRKVMVASLPVIMGKVKGKLVNEIVNNI